MSSDLGAGEHFHHMPVRVHAEDLQAPIRAMPRFALHLNAVGLQDLGDDRGIGELEGIVECATGADVFGRGRKACGGAAFMGLNQMDLLVADLKPGAGEVESGAWDDFHSQDVAVKLAAPLQVGDDERDVIDSSDLECGHVANPCGGSVSDQGCSIAAIVTAGQVASNVSWDGSPGPSVP